MLSPGDAAAVKNHLHPTASSIFKDEVRGLCQAQILIYLLFWSRESHHSFGWSSGSDINYSPPSLCSFSGTHQLQTTYTNICISIAANTQSFLKASPLTGSVPVRNYYASMHYISYNKCTCSQARSAMDFLITSFYSWIFGSRYPSP